MMFYPGIETLRLTPKSFFFPLNPCLLLELSSSPYTFLPNNGDTDVPTLILLKQLEPDLEQCEGAGG